MGFMDIFKADTEFTIKSGELCTLIKEAAKADLLMNAVNCGVPYCYIREIMTGIKEEKQTFKQGVLCIGEFKPGEKNDTDTDSDTEKDETGQQDNA